MVDFPKAPIGYEPQGLLKVIAGEQEARVIHRFEYGDSPTELCINGTGDTLYFLNRDVYRYTLTGGENPLLFIESPYDLSFNGGFYGLEVDVNTSEVYVTDAIDHVQRGIVYRYTPDGKVGDTFKAGISPGAFCFKPPN